MKNIKKSLGPDLTIFDEMHYCMVLNFATVSARDTL